MMVSYPELLKKKEKLELFSSSIMLFDGKAVNRQSAQELLDITRKLLDNSFMYFSSEKGSISVSSDYGIVLFKNVDKKIRIEFDESFVTEFKGVIYQVKDIEDYMDQVIRDLEK